MAKSRDAFRTISEVSAVLDTPAHVLRFWESKFNQIKPVKRAGGRRYYRPVDLALLAAIKDLLHHQGMSIKQTQKHLRDMGVKRMTAEGQALLDGDADDVTGVQDADAKDAPLEDVVEAAKPAQPIKDDPEQIDLFGGMDLPVTPPRPAPSLQIISAKPIPDPAPEPEPEQQTATFLTDEQDLPPAPEPRTQTPARILATLVQADPAHIRAHAAQITPMLERLTALRDELRHPW